MQTKTNTRTVFIQEPTKLKLLLSRKCESKIRTACEVFPHTEWSGAAFYTYTRKKDDTTNMEETELMIVDFCLQDIGTGSYTEYSLDSDSASYYAENIHDLLGCKVCLIHSHNNFNAFFSGIDVSTLKEQAEQCNNVLSLVVNNAGQYVAKFTEKHVITNKVHTTNHIHEEDKWKYMGEKEDNTDRDYYTQEDSENSAIEIRCWDCDIERPLDVNIDEDFKKECIEKIDIFKKRKEEQKAIKVGSNFKDIPSKHEWYQPNLFGDDWDYAEQAARSTTIMTNSLFELSFKSNICVSTWYQDILRDNLSPTFLQCFIDAWLEYYNPDANELQKVMDKFNLRTESNCDYPQTKDIILTYLSDIQQEYIESEYNDEQNIRGYGKQPYKAG